MDYSIVAKVKNVTDKKGISLYINGKKTDKFQFDTRDGEIATLTVLKPGKNTFRITATNKAGKAEAETYVQTTRKVSVPGGSKVRKPTIADLNNTVPVVNPLSPNTSRVRITATIRNIIKKDQITFKLNGKNITDFTFDAKSGKFTALVELSKGKTEVYLSAKNSAGNVVKEKTIEFKEGGQSAYLIPGEEQLQLSKESRALFIEGSGFFCGQFHAKRLATNRRLYIANDQSPPILDILSLVAI